MIRMTKKSIIQQNYPLAPIIEAVIDIRVVPAKEFDFSKLDYAVREKFLKEYPLVAKQFQNEFQLVSGEHPQATPISSSMGLRFSSDNNNQILQIKVDGFTFSRLAPYENWETFRDKAKQLWMIYQKTTLPQHITRIAVRFINRFDFPGTTIELSDYLNVFPHVPESNLMKGFSMQATFNQTDINSTLIITQVLIPSHKPDTVSILLDFDLFNEDLRSLQDDFWLFLEELRTRKNQIFENSITDKTRGLIS
jgi:uncharacterized protein (TIGR04255 family)